MLTKEQLLDERQRHLQAAKHFEDLLRSLHGWEPPAPEKTEVKTIPVRPSRDRGVSNGISYAAEVQNFLDTLPESQEFTINDFKSYLYDKFGKSAVNDTSISVPFRKQIGQTIHIHEKGQGGNPNTYLKTHPLLGDI